MNKREEDVAMMRDPPDMWPRWPVLPLVRKSSADPLGELGFLVDKAGVKFTVFKGNIFMIPKDFTTLPSEKYYNFEAILNAGWEVN